MSTLARLKVVPFEDNRYHVESESGHDPYLVDLDHEGQPFCGCRDFEHRVAPELSKPEHLRTEKAKAGCKHLNAVHEFLLEQSR